jgi:hypothetical protein
VSEGAGVAVDASGLASLVTGVSALAAGASAPPLITADADAGGTGTASGSVSCVASCRGASDALFRDSAASLPDRDTSLQADSANAQNTVPMIRLVCMSDLRPIRLFATISRVSRHSHPLIAEADVGVDRRAL